MAFDVHVATTLYILLKLWLCGMTAFLCGRGLGLSLNGTRFFSVAWMLGSYNLVWPYWPLPDVAAWAPVLLWSVEKILQQSYRRGLFGMAFSGTLLLLAGHPETAFTLALGIGTYFFVRLMLQRPDAQVLLRQVGACAAAWAMALALCAAQILPFVEYLPRSHTFGHRPEEHAGAFSLPLDHIAGLWAPRYFGLTAKGHVLGVGKLQFELRGHAIRGCRRMVRRGVAVGARRTPQGACSHGGGRRFLPVVGV